MGFYPSYSCVVSTVWNQHMDATETMKKKVDMNYARMVRDIFIKILEAAHHKTAAVQ